MHISAPGTEAMKSARRLVVCVFLSAFLCSWRPLETVCAAEAPATDVTRLALLVGIDKYPNLAAHEQLAGCVNDTRLMRELLMQRFGFPEAGIVTLHDEAATGDAIRQQFRALVDRIQLLPADGKPIQIVFHFSGHGSQVADQPTSDPDFDELDGLDETLVPSDATKQGGPEDVRDDELFAFVEQLCAGDKARVWLILDCCHSGTGARGATRFRSLTRGSMLPLEVEPVAARRVTARRLPAGTVILSACRSNEKEPEYQEGGQSYGLLTRFVTQVLSEEQAVSRLTYEALCESLSIHYRRAGISQAPTPQLEGNGRSVVLTADSSLDHQAIWKVRADPRDRSQATLAAGALHGITVGSLFELFVATDRVVDRTRLDQIDVDEDPSRTWLKVDRVEAATAGVKVVGWRQGQQIPASLPMDFTEGFAIERHHEHGGFALRARVVRAVDESEDSRALDADDPTLPTAIRETLVRGRRDESESRWLEWVSDDTACDVLIRIVDPYLAVFPATGNNVVTPQQLATRGDTPTALKGGWGPLDCRLANAPQILLDMLRQINRVRNLQSVVSSAPRKAGQAPEIKLELVQIEVDERINITADRPWPESLDENGHKSLVMRDGALYTVRVTNLAPAASQQAIYVTVFHVDANMGIDVLLPYQEGATEEQLIPAGESRLSGPFQCNAAGEQPIHGLRTAIVLATREPNDFHMLASPSLPVARGAVAPTIRLLDDLLVEKTYFRSRGGSTRMRPTQATDGWWASATIQWVVQP